MNPPVGEAPGDTVAPLRRGRPGPQRNPLKSSLRRIRKVVRGESGDALQAGPPRRLSPLYLTKGRRLSGLSTVPNFALLENAREPFFPILQLGLVRDEPLPPHPPGGPNRLPVGHNYGQAIEFMKDPVDVMWCKNDPSLTTQDRNPFAPISLQLDVYHHQLQICMKDGTKTYVSIRDIKDVRWGHMPYLRPDPHLSQHGPAKSNPEEFCIVTGAHLMDWGFLNIVPSNSVVTANFVYGLRALMSVAKAYHNKTELYLRELFVKLTREHSLPLASWTCFDAFASRLNQPVDSSIASHPPEALRNCPLPSNFAEFFDLFAIFYSEAMPALKAVFRSLSNGCSIMGTEQLKAFLVDQKDKTLTDDVLHNILAEYESSPDYREQQRLSLGGFVKLMLSREHGDAFSFREANVREEDMDRPLSEYFISSSHNTYVVDKQNVGKSSVELYVQVLLTNCRTVELDAWDGDDGEPIITHAVAIGTGHYHSFLSKIKFKDVVLAIERSAFEASVYPVVLSIENHCSVPQQARISEIFREAFGSKLCEDFLPNVPLDRLPSPMELKGKILIKNKKIAYTPTEQAIASAKQATATKLASLAREGTSTSIPLSSIFGSLESDELKQRRSTKDSVFSSTETQSRPSVDSGLHDGSSVRKTSDSDQSSLEKPDNFGTPENGRLSPGPAPRAQGTTSPQSRLGNTSIDSGIPPTSPDSHGTYRRTSGKSMDSGAGGLQTHAVLEQIAEESSPRSAVEDIPLLCDNLLEMVPRTSARFVLDEGDTVCASTPQGIDETGVEESGSSPRDQATPRQSTVSRSTSPPVESMPDRRFETLRRNAKKKLRTSFRRRRASAAGGEPHRPQSSLPAPLDRHLSKYQNLVQMGYKQPQVAPELSQLVIYTRSVKFQQFASELPRKQRKVFPYENSSFNESAAPIRKMPEFMLHNMHQLTRIYPKPTRTNSSNQNPLDFWGRGSQLVALNYQRTDLPMIINYAMFERNGGSGYVLKPLRMRDQTAMNADRASAFNKRQVSFNVLGLVGTTPSSNLVLDISLLGDTLDEDLALRKTFSFRLTTADPMCSASFTLMQPDLSMVYFALFNRPQGGAGTLLAQRVVPFASLADGFRLLGLNDEHYHPIPSCSLFLHVQSIDLLKGQFQRNLRRASMETRKRRQLRNEGQEPKVLFIKVASQLDAEGMFAEPCLLRVTSRMTAQEMVQCFLKQSHAEDIGAPDCVIAFPSGTALEAAGRPGLAMDKAEDAAARVLYVREHMLYRCVEALSGAEAEQLSTCTEFYSVKIATPIKANDRQSRVRQVLRVWRRKAKSNAAVSNSEIKILAFNRRFMFMVDTVTSKVCLRASMSDLEAWDATNSGLEITLRFFNHLPSVEIYTGSRVITKALVNALNRAAEGAESAGGSVSGIETPRRRSSTLPTSQQQELRRSQQQSLTPGSAATLESLPKAAAPRPRVSNAAEVVLPPPEPSSVVTEDGPRMAAPTPDLPLEGVSHSTSGGLSACVDNRRPSNTELSTSVQMGTAQSTPELGQAFGGDAAAASPADSELAEAVPTATAASMSSGGSEAVWEHNALANAMGEVAQVRRRRTTKEWDSREIMQELGEVASDTLYCAERVYCAAELGRIDVLTEEHAGLRAHIDKLRYTSQLLPEHNALRDRVFQAIRQLVRSSSPDCAQSDMAIAQATLVHITQLVMELRQLSQSTVV